MPERTLDLGREIGPGRFKLPLWMWAAAGVGGYLLYRRVQSVAGPSDQTGTDQGPLYVIKGTPGKPGPEGERGKRGRRGHRGRRGKPPRDHHGHHHPPPHRPHPKPRRYTTADQVRHPDQPKAPAVERRERSDPAHVTGRTEPHLRRHPAPQPRSQQGSTAPSGGPKVPSRAARPAPAPARLRGP